MSTRILPALLATSALLITACQDQAVTVINNAPNVAITTPTDGQEMAIGTLAPTFTAVIEDDSSKLEDMTLVWSLAGFGELTGDTTSTDDGVSLVVDGEIPAGNHTLTLKAIDDEGAQGEDVVEFSVVANPAPDLTLVSPVEGERIGLGDVVEVSLLVEDENQQDLTQIALTWGGLAEGYPDAPDAPDSLGLADFYVLDLDLGTHTLSVQGVDSLGGVGTTSAWVEVVDPDNDGDGYDSEEFGGQDCDDTDATSYPGGEELCDGADNDCDGTIDEGTTDAITFYADEDGDTYGDPENTLDACDVPEGYTTDTQDCDDSDATIHPDGVEVCDGADNDCDGTTDGPGATDALTWYADLDGDTYGDPDVTTLDCDQPSRYVSDSTDCDDSDPAVSPTATELCNGYDDNCDGDIDENSAADADTWYADTDSDGHGDLASPMNACEQPSGYDPSSDDCDDTDPDVSPSDPEVCNSIDDDCDGDVDEDSAIDAPTWYADTDADTFGDAGDTTQACSEPSGYAADSTDCDDTDGAVNPDGEEVCDSIDNDCDTEVDEDSASDVSTWYADSDGDGFGDIDSTDVDCYEPTGFVADTTDCDDTNADVNPDAIEKCDTIDNNCDGDIDEDTADDVLTWYADSDGDSYGDPAVSDIDCDQPSNYVADDTDCDDTVASTNPGADEYCNSVDDDCNGTVDDDYAVDAPTWYADTDGDTYGDAGATVVQCSAPTAYVPDATDCDDTDGSINPGATEHCDAIDNDCDTVVDEDDADDASTWYADDDSDGYGDPSSSDIACYQPTSYVGDDTDCDDTDGAVYPGADEYCNLIDDNCDGTVDEDSALDVQDWYDDADSDDYGDALGSANTSCYGDSGQVADSSDCDDAEATTYPGADEYCDDVDNDCDGTVDNDAVDGDYYNADDDADGMGDPDVLEWTCSGPDNDWDCDDADAAEPQVVDLTASGTSADGSKDYPWTHVQDGIDNANSCVVVAAGTYFEQLDFSGKSLEVRSIEGPDTTILDASGLGGPVVNLGNGEVDAVLAGFSLTGGEGYSEETSVTTDCDSTYTCTDYYTTYCGGGVFAQNATATLEDLVVYDNTLAAASATASGNDTYYVYSFGGGICSMNSSLALTGVHAQDNYADQGGGAYLDASSAIDWQQGMVVGNSATDGGGIQVDGGDLSLTNVGVAVNDASGGDGGGILAFDGSVTAVNATIALNLGASGAGLYLSGSSTGDLNSVIVYGDGSSDGILAESTATFTGVYSDVYGFSTNYNGTTDVTGTNGNLDSDPTFSSVSNDGDWANDDWTLSSGSPAIDAGSPNLSMLDADGTPNDMGVYGGPNSDWAN